MAENTAFRNNALPYPVYGVPWTIVFPMLDEDGDPVTGLTCDSEVSINGETGADCTNEGTEIAFTTATNKGMYYLTLTAAEMTGDIITVTVYSGATTTQATCIVLYPRKLVQLATGTSQGGDTAYITLAAGTVLFNGQFSGCLCVATIDTVVEARILQVCTSSNQQCTVTPAWNTAPDANDTYVIYLPEGMQFPTVNVKAVADLLASGTNLGTACAAYSATRGLSGTALPAAAADAVGGLAISDAGGLDLDAIKVRTDRIPNVAAGAAGGIFIAGSNAATTVATWTCTAAATNGSTVLGNTTMGTLTQTGAVAWGASTFASIAVTGALSVGTTTTLTGNVSLGGTLTVTGTTTLAAITQVGAVSLGATTIASAAITGALSVGTTTTFTGIITATAANDIRGVKPAAGGIVAASFGAGAIDAASIADAAIDNATFAADVGSTAYATNIIALAARKVLDELSLDNVKKTIARITCAAGGSAISVITNACSPAGAVADQFKDCTIVFDAATTTAALRGVRKPITASTDAATPVLTVDTLPASPALGDTATIL